MRWTSEEKVTHFNAPILRPQSQLQSPLNPPYCCYSNGRRKREDGDGNREREREVYRERERDLQREYQKRNRERTSFY
jgi:hypothetical protein